MSSRPNQTSFRRPAELESRLGEPETLWLTCTCPASVGTLCFLRRASAAPMVNTSSVLLHRAPVYANLSQPTPSCLRRLPQPSPPPPPPPRRNQPPVNTQPPPAMFRIYPSTAFLASQRPGRPTIRLFRSPHNSPTTVTPLANFRS